MLTDLSFLQVGKSWPPKSEIDRLEMYKQNRKLFENGHADVYKRAFARIERVIGNFEEVVSYPIIINYQKLISLKVADLLLGEPPIIKAGEAESQEQKAIDKIIENTDLFNTAYENAIDISRFGDGVLLVYKDGNRGLIDVTQPSIWFPVVDKDNIKKILNHVLAWTYTEGEGNRKQIYLKVRVYYREGYYEETIFSLKEGVSEYKIQSVVQEPKRVETGLKDFPIMSVPNVITSDRITGMDDYTDVDSIISELLIRLGQISRVLDKHAAPSVEGPSTALEKDPVTGEWKLKMGNFFPRDNKDDPETKYIVWNAQMEANFKTIEHLINALYTISEMGSAIFGDMTSKTGQVPSGSALKRLMISPLAKVNRIRMRLDPALKKAIKLCSQLRGDGIIDLTDVPLSITWQDGLPNDPKEEAEIMNMRTQKSTMSISRAIKQYDGMNDKEAEEELQRIQEEEQAANPFNVPLGGDVNAE